MPTVPAPPAPGLPNDSAGAVLLGQAWRPATSGPALVTVRGRKLVDPSSQADTLAELLERPAVVRDAPGLSLGPVQAVPDHTFATPPWTYDVGALLKHRCRQRMES